MPRRVGLRRAGLPHQKVAAFGKLQLPDITGIPDWGWFLVLAAVAGVVFWQIEARERKAACAVT